MKNHKITFILSLVGLLIVSAAGLAFAQNTSPNTLSFLVNATDKISLQITIPDKFIPVVGNNKVEDAIKNGLIEYIPKTEMNEKKWTELLTIIPLRGSSTQAHIFRDSVLGELKTKTKNFTMVNSAFKTEKSYQVATAIARYQLDGRTEILYFYAISGPVNSVSVQYIKAISPNDDLPKLLNELSAIFAKNVVIIK